MKLTTLALTCSALALGSAAMADDTGRFSVGAGVSTMGGTLEVGYRLNSNIRVRGLLNGGLATSRSENLSNGGLSGTGVLKGNIGGGGVIADYYPIQSGWASGFRISGGLYYNASGVSAKVTGNNLVFNGVTYPTGEYSLAVDFKNKVAPMITTGYDWNIGNNWTISGELGAMFTGGIDTKFSGTNATLVNDILADADVIKARKQLSDIKVLPYIGLGVSYRF